MEHTTPRIRARAECNRNFGAGGGASGEMKIKRGYA